MDTYLGIFPGFGANDLSFLTFNGYNNISILQGTVVTLTSAPYGTPTRPVRHEYLQQPGL